MNVKQAAKLTLLSAALVTTSFATANEELAGKSNCLACHNIDKKVLGPSFQDIAAKYKDDDSAAEMLVDKVKNGGKGNWGEVPMPPNPMLSDEDAATLVEWVLSL